MRALVRAITSLSLGESWGPQIWVEFEKWGLHAFAEGSSGLSSAHLVVDEHDKSPLRQPRLPEVLLS